MAYTDNKTWLRIEDSILALVAAVVMVMGSGTQRRAASAATKVAIAPRA